jgi:hypothetical protein
MHHLFEFLLLQHLPPEARHRRHGPVVSLLPPWGDTPVISWIFSQPGFAQVLPLLSYEPGKSLDDGDIYLVVQAVDAVRQMIWDHRLAEPYLFSEVTSVLRAAGLRSSAEEYWCGGTSDCVLMGKRDDRSVMLVCDLKTGRNRVAPDDPQLLLYAAMMLDAFSDSGFDLADLAADGVVTAVIQPKVTPPVSFHSCSPTEISTLVQDVVRVKTAVEQQDLSSTSPPRELLQAGTHCQYCRRREVCPAYADDQRRNMELAIWEAPGPQTLPAPVMDMSVAELLKLNSLEPVVQQFLADVQKELIRRAHRGVRIPGKKLVASFGNREWHLEKGLTGEQMVYALAQALSVPPEVFAETSAATPAEVERRLMARYGLKRREATEAVGNLVTTRVRGVRLCDASAAGDEIQPEAVVKFLEILEEHASHGDDC